MPPKFFITHSSKDIVFARRLCDDLVAQGLGGFFDATAIQPGDIISADVDKGLIDCDVYVPILSHVALQSRWCKEEIHTAITLSLRDGRNGRPRIIPVLIEDCADEMPAFLQVRLYIEFANRYDEAFKELLAKGFGIEAATTTQPTVRSEPAQKVMAPPVKSVPDPNSAEGYYERGVELYKKGNLDLALAEFSRAIELDPGYADAYYYRGYVFKAQGERERGRTNDLNNLRNWHNPKILMKGDDLINWAIADFTQAIKFDPKHAGAYFARGQVYENKGDLDHAVADYDHAIQYSPQYAYAYFRRGNTYLNKAYRDKRFAPQAIADFEAYLRLAPNDTLVEGAKKYIAELKRMR